MSCTQGCTAGSPAAPQVTRRVPPERSLHSDSTFALLFHPQPVFPSSVLTSINEQQVGDPWKPGGQLILFIYLFIATAARREAQESSGARPSTPTLPPLVERRRAPTINLYGLEWETVTLSLNVSEADKSACSACPPAAAFSCRVRR